MNMNFVWVSLIRLGRWHHVCSSGEEYGGRSTAVIFALTFDEAMLIGGRILNVV